MTTILSFHPVNSRSCMNSEFFFSLNGCYTKDKKKKNSAFFPIFIKNLSILMTEHLFVSKLQQLGKTHSAETLGRRCKGLDEEDTWEAGNEESESRTHKNGRPVER